MDESWTNFVQNFNKSSRYLMMFLLVLKLSVLAKLHHVWSRYWLKSFTSHKYRSYLVDSLLLRHCTSLTLKWKCCWTWAWTLRCRRKCRRWFSCCARAGRCTCSSPWTLSRCRSEVKQTISKWAKMFKEWCNGKNCVLFLITTRDQCSKQITITTVENK